VVLLNGEYTGTFSTKRAGVMIRAQNKHQAILRSSGGLILRVDNDDTTVHGLRFDGERKNVLLSVASTSREISNVILEENIFENSSRAGMSIGGNQGAKNIIIRYNLIQSTGWQSYGEGIYIGTNRKRAGSVSVQIYGNIIRGFTLNGIDLKSNSRNAQIHHNIFEEQVPATPTYRPGHQLAGRRNEGTISSKGTGNYIHDNIFRNLVDAGPGIFWASEDGGHRIVNNVIMGVDKTQSAIAIAGQRFGGAPTEITNNTFCDLPNYKSNNIDGAIVRDNIGLSGVVPDSHCRAEIERILSEMKNLRDLDAIDL
jgi:hypothetical protein